MDESGTYWYTKGYNPAAVIATVVGRCRRGDPGAARWLGRGHAHRGPVQLVHRLRGRLRRLLPGWLATRDADCAVARRSVGDMRIWVINPNTTESMTDKIGDVRPRRRRAGYLGRPAVTSEMGPPSIESHYDEALSVPGAARRDRSAVRPRRRRLRDRLLRRSRPRRRPRARRAGRWSGSPRRRCTRPAIWAAAFSVVTTLARTRGRACGPRGTLWDAAVLPRRPRLRDPGARSRHRPRCAASSSPRRAGRPSNRTDPTSWCWAARAWPTCARTSRTRSGAPGGRRRHGRDADRAVARHDGIAHVEAGGVRRASTEGLFGGVNRAPVLGDLDTPGQPHAVVGLDVVKEAFKCLRPRRTARQPAV